MATGSRRWFGYLDDNGGDYAVELDESTYETVALGFGLVQQQAVVISQSSKRPLTMRYLNLVRVEAGETIRKSVYVGTFSELVNITADQQVTIAGEVWGVSSYRGESRKLVPRFDTEMLDGDEDINVA